MKRILSATLVLMVFLVVPLAVSAETSGPPTADTYFPGTHGTETKLQVTAQNLPAYIESNRVYMEWDLSTRPTNPAGAAVNYARLTLTTTGVPTAGTYKFELWSVADSGDTWDETSSFASLAAAPALGAKLADATVALNSGTAAQPVTFQSADLAAHFEAARKAQCCSGPGNAKAGLAVKMVEPLPGSGVFPVTFSSKEAGSPALLLTNTDETAVTLRTFRSADPAVNWPLIAGIALLAVLVGGFGVYRWRLSRVRG